MLPPSWSLVPSVQIVRKSETHNIVSNFPFPTSVFATSTFYDFFVYLFVSFFTADTASAVVLKHTDKGNMFMFIPTSPVFLKGERRRRSLLFILLIFNWIYLTVIIIIFIIIIIICYSVLKENYLIQPSSVSTECCLECGQWPLLYIVCKKKINGFSTKSFRYKFKQWICTKISFTSSIVCAWTRKTFWVNILRSFSQVRGTTYTSRLNKRASKRLCIETTGNH